MLLLNPAKWRSIQLSMLHRLQITAARALLEWTRSRLSDESGVSHRTIARFESGEGDITSTKLAQLEWALTRAGVRFVEDGVALDGLSKQLWPHASKDG